MKVYHVTPHAKGWAVRKTGVARATSIHGVYRGKRKGCLPYAHAYTHAVVKLHADVVYVHDGGGRVDFVWYRKFDIQIDSNFAGKILEMDSLLKSSAKKKEAAAQKRIDDGFAGLDRSLKVACAMADKDNEALREAGRKISEANGHADMVAFENMARIIIPELAKIIRAGM